MATALPMNMERTESTAMIFVQLARSKTGDIA
jgi:hypothetical protein